MTIEVFSRGYTHRRPHLAYSAPAWKDELIMDRTRSAVPSSFSRTGNVFRLPAPVCGYRMIRERVGYSLDVQTNRGFVVQLGWWPTPDEAEGVLALVSAENPRPMLGEFDRSAVGGSGINGLASWQVLAAEAL